MERMSTEVVAVPPIDFPLSNLLATKLFVPPARPNLVVRPRLFERIQTGMRDKLTLIAAPARHLAQAMEQLVDRLVVDSEDEIATLRSLWIGSLPPGPRSLQPLW